MSWQDQKAAIRKKKRCNVQSLNKTGGGPLETIDINDDEMSVIVPTVTVFGNKNIDESMAKFDDDSIEDDELKDTIIDGIHEDTYVIDDTKKNYDVIDDINRIINVENDSNIEFKNEAMSLSNELKSFETPTGPSDIKKNPGTDLVLSPKSTRNIKNDHSTNSQVSTSKHPRASAVQRQKLALKNSENIIEVSKKEVNIREKFYHQKLYYLAKTTHLKNTQSRALHSLTNKLFIPYFLIPPW
ncbi:hypothetical protein HCN44_007215 [Aphidius gifuensis]|uniref:Uncharacterized protein n=1 Tax=Aphidius gifuensis TaxID=684658 RepID=A0A834XL29_APHGI|nr:hypothetical protein HCN44_007215 [Aphidius gifuensis]